MASRVTERRVALSAFVLLAIVFVAWPEIDLAVAARFHENDWAWLLPRESPLIAWPYQAVPVVGRLLVGLLLLGWLASCLPRCSLRPQRLLFAFLLAGALAGPALVVDAGLKNHLGRARPAQIEAFGGSQQFTPAFVPSTQCERNCSFVSGHVATTAFVVMILGWLGSPRIRQRWLLASLGAAAYMSLVRMAMGGHFLSDCLFAWFATYFSLDLVEWLFVRIAWLGMARQAFVDSARVAAERCGLAPGMASR